MLIVDANIYKPEFDVRFHSQVINKLYKTNYLSAHAPFLPFSYLLEDNKPH